MYLMDRSPGVLIAEGQAAARRLLIELLGKAGMRTFAATDGHTALRMFYDERPDLVLLGLELVAPSGWQVLATIRELSDVPVLLLAERASESEKVRALRAGADDFLHKPFGRAEVIARAEVLLRRPRSGDGPEVYLDEFVRVDHRRHEVEILGKTVDLTPIEFRMLVTFCRHAGQALSHAQLLSTVWGDGERDPREVKLYVSYLRRKLRCAGVEPVETVRGIGYRYRPRPTEPARSSATPRDKH